MTTDLKLEVGKSYRTRGGWKARVICTDSGADFSIIAIRADGEPMHEADVSHHLPDGRTALTVGTLYDLISPWVDRPVITATWPAWAKAAARVPTAGGAPMKWKWFDCIPSKCSTQTTDGWCYVGNSVEFHPSEIPAWTGDWRESLVVRPS